MEAACIHGRRFKLDAVAVAVEVLELVAVRGDYAAFTSVFSLPYLPTLHREWRPGGLTFHGLKVTVV